MADNNRGMFKQVYVMLLGALLFSGAVVANSDTSLLSQQRPAETLCRAPLQWYVDEIDPRFGFTRSEVNTAAVRAAEMWNQAAGVELFTLGERDAIRVSLVYDHRQQLQEFIADLDERIARLGEQVADLDTTLASERAQLEASRQHIDTMNERIAIRAAEAEEMINQHANRRGQVSRQVAERVNAFQAQTQQLVDQQNTEVNRYNRLQADFNTRVNMRNRLAGEQNALVVERNQAVQNRQVEWQRRGLGTESGRHNIQIRTTRRGTSVVDEAITIFSASNELGLATILAHEFGHAIGINHVAGVTSIMSARIETQAPGAYPQNLSRQDLAALALVCDQAN
ncbi:MAG: matrixin family metalloprotease [Idiomarina sp.]|nr:matrixin family metalloprotease [Idiomarina sp.]